MEKSFIERELLIEKIKGYYHKYSKLEESGDAICEKLDAVTDILCEVMTLPLNEIPAAPAETTWTITAMYATIAGRYACTVWKCNNCNEAVSRQEFIKPPPYCPHCGAKTKEEV